MGGGALASDEMLEGLEAREDLVRRLEEEFDLELLDMATRAVRERIAPKTWEAYRLTVRGGPNRCGGGAIRHECRHRLPGQE